MRSISGYASERDSLEFSTEANSDSAGLRISPQSRHSRYSSCSSLAMRMVRACRHSEGDIIGLSNEQKYSIGGLCQFAKTGPFRKFSERAHRDNAQLTKPQKEIMDASSRTCQHAKTLGARRICHID